MDLVPYTLDLSQLQLSKLSKGMSVRVTPSQLDGDGTTLHLTSEQATKLNRCKKSRKGCNLQLSAGQIAHHSGSGLFDTLKAKAKELALQGLQKGLELAKDKAVDFAKDKAGDLANMAAQKLQDKISTVVMGNGLFSFIPGYW